VFGKKGWVGDDTLIVNSSVVNVDRNSSVMSSSFNI
jgi:hypothetical protein